MADGGTKPESSDNIIADINVPDQQRETALKEKANKASKLIWVTFRKEGIHKYPAALDLSLIHI